MTKKPEPKFPGHYIRQWRKTAGMSQETLAELVGLSHGAISQLETGVTTYTQGSLERFAAAFNCTPADLLAGPPAERQHRAAMARLRKALVVFENLTQERQERILAQIEDAALVEGVQSPPPAQ